VTPASRKRILRSGFAPQFSGNTIPVGSQWDFDVAIAQARFDLKQLICKGTALDAAYQTASDNLGDQLSCDDDDDDYARGSEYD